MLKGEKMLYRKYRPKILSEIYGQNEIVEELKKEFSESGFAKGYIITGEKGTGKTSVGRLIISSMLCENFSEEGCCSKCTSCRKIRNGTLEEFIEADLSVKESVFSLEKELLSVEKKGIFFLIKNAELMSDNLKTIIKERIEDKEGKIVPILVSDEEINFFNNFKKLHLVSLNTESMIELLKKVSKSEKYRLKEDVIAIIANSSKGNMKKSLCILERAFQLFGTECTAEQVSKIVSGISLKTARTFYNKLLTGDKERIAEWIETVDNEGADSFELLLALEDFVAEEDILGSDAEFRLKIMEAVQQVLSISSNFPQMNNSFYLQYFMMLLFPYAGRHRYISSPVLNVSFFEDSEAENVEEEKSYPFVSETLKVPKIEGNYSKTEIELLEKIENFDIAYIDLDVKELKDNWDLIVMKVSSQNPSLGMALQSAFPKIISNGIIHIAFPLSSKFMYNRIKKRTSDKKLVEEAINAEFSAKAQVCFELLSVEEEAEMVFET